jgi:hypothetical protein
MLATCVPLLLLPLACRAACRWETPDPACIAAQFGVSRAEVGPPGSGAGPFNGTHNFETPVSLVFEPLALLNFQQIGDPAPTGSAFYHRQSLAVYWPCLPPAQVAALLGRLETVGRVGDWARAVLAPAPALLVIDMQASPAP